LIGISDQSAGQKRQCVLAILMGAHFQRSMGVVLLWEFLHGSMVLNDRGKGNTR
jgi:hypothetical protein